MARWIYSALFYLAQPLVLLRLLWRARRQPEYRQHWAERYGFYVPRSIVAEKLLWLHAVSLGETRAAEPLIEALLAQYPEHHLLLTHMTPTGRAAGGEICERYGARVSQAYLPYDLPGAVGRFLQHYAPHIGLLMETELWPNLLAAAKARDLPMLLLNARLSERSQRGYQRFLPLIRPALQALHGVAAQTAADAERLIDLGLPRARLHVCGNLKFDVTPSPEKRQLGASWRQQLGTRPVYLAASTREGEEALLLNAWLKRHEKRVENGAAPDILLLLVPRHPQRFYEVVALLAARGLTFCRRSEGALPSPETQVWLGDSMGEMPAYFALADLALIGGTLLPFGGQNLIEAAACGCPVLVGPYCFNFAQATADALASGAAQRVDDAADAVLQAEKLLPDRAALQAMRAAAEGFSQAHRGATARTLAVIDEALASCVE